MLVAEYEGLFDSIKKLFHFGSGSSNSGNWSGGNRKWISNPTIGNFGKTTLSFPSLGIGKQATITINGLNQPNNSLFKWSNAFKSNSNGLNTFFTNLWKKGLAPAISLGIAYATQKSILKAAGVKNADYIVAKQLGLPTYPHLLPSQAKVFSPTPPTSPTPPQRQNISPRPQVEVVVSPPKKASNTNHNNKTMLFLLGGIAIVLLLSRR